MVVNGISELPLKMKNHITDSLKKALRKWKDDGNSSVSVDNLLNQIVTMEKSKNGSAAFRAGVHQNAETLALSLEFMGKSNPLLSSLNDTSVKKILDEYAIKQAYNREVFKHITTHHENLAHIQNYDDDEVEHKDNNTKIDDKSPEHHSHPYNNNNKNRKEKDWNTIISHKNAEAGLDIYAQAATSMGSKEWVKNGQQWMENFCLDFFCDNGAIDSYIKQMKCEYFNQNQKVMPLYEIENLQKSLSCLVNPSVSISQLDDDSTNVLNHNHNNHKQSNKVRVLDVGSCYNPHKNQPKFDVLALDLMPTDKSVYKCDFLKVNILPYGHGLDVDIDISSNITDTSTDTDTNTNTDTGIDRSVSAGNLHGIPRNTFHALMLSLVLNYLPSPSQRADMIKIARQLLISPPIAAAAKATNSDSDINPPPHEAGILLIMEKGSILSGNQINGQHQLLLSHWKESITAMGFQLLTYQIKNIGKLKYHLFAFKVADLKLPDIINNSPCFLYCKNDLIGLSEAEIIDALKVESHTSNKNNQTRISIDDTDNNTNEDKDERENKRRKI